MLGWQVPSHYERVAEDTAAQRSTDATGGVRVLNGFGKELLIREALASVERDPSSEARVVDLAAGRGGDVGRFARTCTAAGRSLTYVGLDVSAHQIAAARKREASASWALPPGSRLAWGVTDCFAPAAVEVARNLGPPEYDVVSCQMALHYAAQTEERMAAALDNCAALCAPGGTLAVTTTDWERIIRYATAEDGDEAAPQSELCSVSLELPWPDQGAFGCGYRFALGSRVDDGEFLIRGVEVRAMLEARGFRQLRWSNMLDYLGQELAKPHVLTEWLAHGKQCTAADQEVVGLYVAALFVKEKDTMV